MKLKIIITMIFCFIYLINYSQKDSTKNRNELGFYYGTTYFPDNYLKYKKIFTDRHGELS